MIMFTSEIDYGCGSSNTFTRKMPMIFSKENLFAGAVVRASNGERRKIIYADFPCYGDVDLLYDVSRFPHATMNAEFFIEDSISLAPLTKLESFHFNKRWQLAREIRRIYHEYLQNPETIEKIVEERLSYPYYGGPEQILIFPDVVPDKRYYDRLQELSQLPKEPFIEETGGPARQLIKIKDFNRIM